MAARKETSYPDRPSTASKITDKAHSYLDWGQALYESSYHQLAKRFYPEQGLKLPRKLLERW